MEKEYGIQSYWEDRYLENTKETFEWLLSWKDIKNIVDEIIPSKDSRILHLGCGNSVLSEVMYDEGYINIVNVDYSDACIK